MEEKDKDLVFRCRKCGHVLYIDNDIEEVNKLIKTECPTCGEEPDDWSGLWVLMRTGNYDKEYGGESDD